MNAKLCPCGKSNGKVLEVRELRGEHHGWVKRRRECEECGFRWNTFEITEGEVGVILQENVKIDKMRVVMAEFMERVESDEG